MELKCRKVNIFLFFAVASVTYFLNTSAKYCVQNLSPIPSNVVLAKVGLKPMKFIAGAANVKRIDYPSETPTSRLHRTVGLQRDMSEQFTPFRYRFSKAYSMNVDTGIDKVSDEKKYLIYRCDDNEFSSCGGWADRIKGIMAAYIIANLTGRIFRWEILYPPCNLQNYIVPNLVNWSLPVPIETSRIKESSDVKNLSYTDNRKFWENVKNINFASLPAMKAKYVYYKSNLDHMEGFRDSKFHYKQVSWMKNMTNDQINAVIFKRLFKMSPQLEAKVNNFLSNNLSPQDKLVCIHIRTGRNPTIPHDTEDRLRMQDLPKIWNFLHGITEAERDKIFVMSDSENVITDAKRQSFGDKVFIKGGNIVHVQNTLGLPAEKICNGLEKVLIEQFVLMHCDSLLISNSGLGRMAAYVRGSDEGLYCVLEGGRVVRAKLRKFNIFSKS